MGREQELLQKYFREVPLFARVPPRHAALIRRDFVVRRVKKGEVIVMQGDGGTELFIVLQGRVRVFLLSAEGEEFTLGELGAGEHFGEVSLVDAKPRSATVVATTDTVLAALRRERLLAAIRDEPRIALELLASLAAIVRRATEREERLAFLGVRERLCHLFAAESASSGAQRRDGFVLLPKWTHRELSARIGASRESVTKALRALARDGLFREEREVYLVAPQICEDGDRLPPRRGRRA